MAKSKSEIQTQAWKKEELEKACPNCKSTSMVRDYQYGKVVCENCGRVLKDDVMDMGPEWRAFDAEQREERSRAGPPMTETIHDKGLSTQIDWKNRDARGKSLPPARRSQMYRLRKWQRRIRVSDAKERNLATALSEIDRMSSQLGLPNSVRESASRIYRRAIDKDLVRGRSIEGVTSAAIYAACRANQLPRTLEEVTGVSRVGKKEIARTYRFISRELELNLPPTDPARYVARFGSELEVSGEVVAKATELIKKTQEEKLTSGKSPVGTAAAAIYTASIMCGEKRSQKEVSEVANITEVTVRNRYKELAEKLGLDVEV